MSNPFKGISDNQCRLHPSKCERVLYCHVTRLDTSKREIKKVGTQYCSFRIECLLVGRSRSGIGVNIFWLKLESESHKIRRLRSPGGVGGVFPSFLWKNCNKLRLLSPVSHIHFLPKYIVDAIPVQPSHFFSSQHLDSFKSISTVAVISPPFHRSLFL